MVKCAPRLATILCLCLTRQFSVTAEHKIHMVYTWLGRLAIPMPSDIIADIVHKEDREGATGNEEFYDLAGANFLLLNVTRQQYQR